jgi:hypothetical protein
LTAISVRVRWSLSLAFAAFLHGFPLDQPFSALPARDGMDGADVLLVFSFLFPIKFFVFIPSTARDSYDLFLYSEQSERSLPSVGIFS